MKKASVARVRSFDTTTSRPSRPCFREESFIATSLFVMLGRACNKIICGETPMTSTTMKRRSFLAGAGLAAAAGTVAAPAIAQSAPGNPLAADLEFPQGARYDLRHRADLRQIHGRGDRQQVPDPDLRGGRDRRRRTGARCGAERHGRIAPTRRATCISARIRRWPSAPACRSA